jgi:hypothetical protein
MLIDEGLELAPDDDSDVHTFDFEMPSHDKYSEISDHPGSMSHMSGPKKRLASTRLQDLLRMGIIKKLQNFKALEK